jgi:hypothetical protein
MAAVLLLLGLAKLARRNWICLCLRQPSYSSGRIRNRRFSVRASRQDLNHRLLLGLMTVILVTELHFALGYV